MRKFDVYCFGHYDHSFMESDAEEFDCMVERLADPENDITEYECNGKPVSLEDVAPEMAEEARYTPRACYGDYSPSCPWNAPGMSIHDFI